MHALLPYGMVRDFLFRHEGSNPHFKTAHDAVYALLIASVKEYIFSHLAYEMISTKQNQVHFEFVLPQLKEAEQVDRIGQDGKVYKIPKVYGTSDLIGTVKIIQAAK